MSDGLPPHDSGWLQRSSSPAPPPPSEERWAVWAGALRQSFSFLGDFRVASLTFLIQKRLENGVSEYLAFSIDSFLTAVCS